MIEREGKIKRETTQDRATYPHTNRTQTDRQTDSKTHSDKARWTILSHFSYA